MTTIHVTASRDYDVLVQPGLLDDAGAQIARVLGTGRTAVLRYGDPQVEQRIDLRKNAEYDIDTGLYTIHLRVENGGIAFVDSPCPDHLCEGFGTLKNEGDWAACMPAKASVTIE
jgi:hypothetical protein